MLRSAVNKLRGTENEATERKPRKKEKKQKKERKGFFHDDWLDDEDDAPKKRKSKKTSVEPELPELARSYRIHDINGDKLETGNVENGPGQDYMDLLRYFIEKFPDVRSEVRTYVNGDGVDLDDRLFMRVYLSVDENPEALEGLDCTTDEAKANEETVLVATKASEAEIAFPEGFRPWSAVKDDNDLPTVLATAEENEKFSKLFAKQLAEKKAAKQAEVDQAKQAQDQPKAEDQPQDTPKEDAPKADDPKDSSK